MAATYDVCLAKISALNSSSMSTAAKSGATKAKTLYNLLCSLMKIIKSGKVADNVMVSDGNLQILEDIVSGKIGVPLSKALQTMLCSLYSTLLSSPRPGYVARNVLSNMLTLISDKTRNTSYSGKECALSLLGVISRMRPMDVGNMLSDIVAVLLKLVKNSSSAEASLKLLSVQALNHIVIGCKSRATDLHAEVLKVVTRVMATPEKSAPVRRATAGLVESLARYSEGCSSVSSDALLACVARALEDDVAGVQNAAAKATAAVYYEVVVADQQVKVQNRASANRGGADNPEGGGSSGSGAGGGGSSASSSSSSGVSSSSSTADRKMTSRLKMMALSVTGGSNSSTKNNDSDYYSVLHSLLNRVVHSTGRATVTGAHGALHGVCLLRTGYITVLAHLVRKLMTAGVDEVASSRSSNGSSGEEEGGSSTYIGDSGEAGLGVSEIQWLIPRLLALVSTHARSTASTGAGGSASSTTPSSPNPHAVDDASPLSDLSPEEVAHFRARVGFVLRYGIVQVATESQLRLVAKAVLAYIAPPNPNPDAGGSPASGTPSSEGDSPTSPRGDVEVSLALSELSHIVSYLGASTVAIEPQLTMAATVRLKDAAYQVRSAAAALLTNLSTVIPGLAGTILASSLTMAKLQVSELIFRDTSHSPVQSSSTNDLLSLDDDAKDDRDGESRSASQGSQNATAERLQRMLTFHGHTLVISGLLRADQSLPLGLPSALVISIFDFGLDLLGEEVLSVPPRLRNVCCSLVRAGALIVSSCLSLGYGDLVQSRIDDLLKIYDYIFKMVMSQTTHSSLPGGSVAGDTHDKSTMQSQDGIAANDLLYEMMYMEAALVCLSSLLHNCPESLLCVEHCLAIITDGLEFAFRIMKSRYQPRLKNHYRFRTLHATILECFSWLPPGSYPHVTQHVYVEALRVLRDGIAFGLDCSAFDQYSGSAHGDVSLLGLSNALHCSTGSMSGGGGISANSSIFSGTASTVSAAAKNAIAASGGDAAALMGATSSQVANITLAVPPPSSELMLMLRLELFTHALGKKEFESSLSVFGRDVHGVVVSMYSGQHVEESYLYDPLLGHSAALAGAGGVGDRGEGDDKYPHRGLSPQASRSCSSSTGVPGGARAGDGLLSSPAIISSQNGTGSRAGVYASRQDWLPPSNPSAHAGSRLLDAAISLLAASFAHQTYEHQNRLVQLCVQAVDQFVRAGYRNAANSMTAIFSGGEEDKKKRGRKAYRTTVTVVTVIAAVVRSFPVHFGMSLELDLPWGEALLSLLQELLLHASSEVKVIAANAIASFALRITGSHIAEQVSVALTRKLGTLLSVCDNSGGHTAGTGGTTTPGDGGSESNLGVGAHLELFSGYTLALAALFESSEAETCDDDVRLQAMATLFDCLRPSRATVISTSFKAYALYALGSIVPGCVRFTSNDGSSRSRKNSVVASDDEGDKASNSSPYVSRTTSHDTTDSSDGAGLAAEATSVESGASPRVHTTATSCSGSAQETAELTAFFDRVFGVIDAHLCSVSESEEGCDLLLGALMRLINVTVPLCIATLPHKGLQVLPHIFQVWETVRAMACHSVPVQRYCATFLTLTGQALFAASPTPPATPPTGETSGDTSSAGGASSDQSITVRDVHRYKRRILYLMKVHYFSLYRGHDCWSDFVDPSVNLILGEAAGTHASTTLPGSGGAPPAGPSPAAPGGNTTTPAAGGSDIEEYEAQGPGMCHHRYDAVILRSLVPFVMLVIERDPALLLAARMDVRLLMFLDQAHCRGTLSVRTALPGLELRSRYYALLLDEYSGCSATLQAEAGAAIRALGLGLSTGSVESSLGPWVLFLRAAALGLRTADDREGGVEESDEEEGTEGEGAGTNNNEPGTSTSGSSGSSGTHGPIIPLSAYVRRIQADAVRQTSTLRGTMRVGTKRVCLESCKDAIVLLLTRDTGNGVTGDAHRSLIHARSAAKESLRRAANGSLPGPALPVYMPLFAEELLTFACALTTHTIEDQLVLPLQIAGMGLLHAAVELLAVVPPPSACTSAAGAAVEAVADSPLSQYSSQLLTAIRPCFELGELVAVPGSSGGNNDIDNAGQSRRRRGSRSSLSGPGDLLDGGVEERSPVSAVGSEGGNAWGFPDMPLQRMYPTAVDPDSMQGLSCPIRGHYSPALLELGGSLTSMLISSGVLTDAIAAKRLIKLLLKFTSLSPSLLSLHGTTTVQDLFGSYEVELGKPVGFPDFRKYPYLSSRASGSTTMSDDMAVIGHVIIARNVARLLVLASDTVPAPFTAASRDVRAMIRTQLKEAPVLSPSPASSADGEDDASRTDLIDAAIPTLLAFVIDSARLLQTTASDFQNPSMYSQDLSQLLHVGVNNVNEPLSGVDGNPGSRSRVPLQCSSASHAGDGGGIGRYNADKGVGLPSIEVDGLVPGVSSACCGGRLGFPSLAITAVDSQYQYLHRTNVGSGGATHAVAFSLTTLIDRNSGPPGAQAMSWATARWGTSLQLRCQPLRALCQVTSYGSTGAGHGGTSFPPADLGYRLVQSQCWGTEQLSPGQLAALTLSEGGSVESMPYYRDPRCADSSNPPASHKGGDMHEAAQATGGLECVSSSAYRGGLTFGTTTDPHWLSSLYNDSLPLLLCATAAIANIDEPRSTSSSGHAGASATVLGILLSSLQAEVSLLSLAGSAYSYSFSDGKVPGERHLARALASTTAYCDALVIPLTSTRANTAPRGTERCLLSRGYRSRRVLLLMTTLSAHAQSWALRRPRNPGPSSGGVALQTWTRIVKSLSTCLLPLLSTKGVRNESDAQMILLEFVRLLQFLAQGPSCGTSEEEEDVEEKQGDNEDAQGLRAAIWHGLVSILAQAGAVQATEETLRAFTGSYADRISLAAALSSASFPDGGGKDGSNEVLPVTQLLVTLESLCTHKKEVKGSEEDEDERLLAILLVVSLLGLPSSQRDKAGEEGDQGNMSPAQTIVTIGTSACTPAGQERLLALACDGIADRLHSLVSRLGTSNDSGESAIQAHLHAWAAASALLSTTIGPPLQITAAASSLVHSLSWRTLYSLLACASPIVRAAAQPSAFANAQGKVATSLLAALLPPVLLSLSSAGMHNTSANAAEHTETESLLDCLLLQAQFLFLSFSAAFAASVPTPDDAGDDDRTEAALGSLLPVLTARLLLLDRDRPRYLRGGSPETSTRLANVEAFIGKGLVQVAKLHAETFRTKVAGLGDAQRNRLQTCMQQALRADAAGTRPQGQTGRHAAPSLKIDASKFGK